MNDWLHSNRSLFLISFFGAILARLLYSLLDIPDFLGDAFHNWFISVATIENNWTYSDYKGRELVWLPFYRYLVSLGFAVFGTTEMWVSDVINVIIAAITCGVVAIFTSQMTNSRYGLMAGITLGLMPSHISYSLVNTPEIFAALLLLLSVYAHLNNQSIWLLPLALIGVLTKNELTTLLVFFGTILLLRKEWRSAAFLLVGGVIGLTIWAWWCYTQTDSWMYWITARASGSRWDHVFQLAQGNSTNRPVKFILYLIRSFPLVVLIPPVLIVGAQTIRKQLAQSSIKLITIIVGLHWLFLFTMAFYFFPQLSVRYFLFTVPLATVMIVSWAHSLNGILKRAFTGAILISIAIAISLQIPTLYLRKFAYAGSREIGIFIQQQLHTDDNFWMDYPLTIYYSQIPIEQFLSGGQVLHKKGKLNSTRISQGLIENNIRYIQSSSVSFSRVHSLWPQTKKPEPFVWNDFQFEPIFHYTPSKYLIEETDWFDREINKVTKRQNESILWKVTPPVSVNGTNPF